MRCIYLFSLILLASSRAAMGQLEFEKEPLNYGKAPTDDPIQEIQQQLDDGTVELEYDEEHGYLQSLLNLLEVQPSSQVLVHSKTSFQLRRISPSRPRAVYFNDEASVGWVQNGDVLELMATDPVLGEIFYTLSQEETERPKFLRDRGQCIICHASSRTKTVPGGLVRSVFASASGQPQFGSGTFTIDHSSPFKERWGGWYVTGTHGKMRHMGNVLSADRSDPEALDREVGANVQDLSSHFDVSPYLTRHSDLVALMVLEHQTQMKNYLTLASYESRSATHYDGIMNAALDRPADHVSDTTKRRIASVGEKLLKYMFFVDEFQLTSPVAGTSTFATDFQTQGILDSQGRSLRALELKTRMFKYPCSYLIYSRMFDNLPPPVKSYVALRMQEILAGQDTSGEFAHLSADDRQSILEILAETKPDLGLSKR
jgi:hypothetical protein